MHITVSSVEERVGKSVLAIIIGGVYSLRQDTVTTLTSNAPFGRSFSYFETHSDKEVILNNVSNLKAALHGADISSDRLISFGSKVGDSRLYVFNPYESKLSKEDIDGVVKNLKSSFSNKMDIVEQGSQTFSEETKKNMVESELNIVVFELCRDQIQKLADGYKTLEPEVQDSMLFICNRVGARFASKTEISKLTGIPAKNILSYPYTDIIARSSFEGNFETLLKPMFQKHDYFPGINNFMSRIESRVKETERRKEEEKR